MCRVDKIHSSVLFESTGIAVQCGSISPLVTKLLYFTSVTRRESITCSIRDCSVSVCVKLFLRHCALFFSALPKTAPDSRHVTTNSSTPRHEERKKSMDQDTKPTPKSPRVVHDRNNNRHGTNISALLNYFIVQICHIDW